MIHSFCVSDLKSKHVNVYNKYRNKYFFDEIKKNVSVHFDYEITSKRVIELLMFEADKKDNKKLI